MGALWVLNCDALSLDGLHETVGGVLNDPVLDQKLSHPVNVVAVGVHESREAVVAVGVSRWDEDFRSNHLRDRNLVGEFEVIPVVDESDLNLTGYLTPETPWPAADIPAET